MDTPEEGARAGETSDDLKEREFQLKILQAWTDGKAKIATTALLANGGLLATAFAYMKDKGADSPSSFALSSAEIGLMGAVFAYGVANAVSEHALKDLADKKEKPLRWFSTKSVEWIYMLGMLLAVGGFFSALAFFSGYTDGSRWCLQNKEACLGPLRVDGAPRK
ncbi:hypothetical protein [Bradyrhizobium diazoefficiens]